MRDQNWLEQVQPADEFIKALGKKFGAPKITALLGDAKQCVLCGKPTEFVGAFEVRDSLDLYGLCHGCADLADCIERAPRPERN